jgi:hypothetical protein
VTRGYPSQPPAMRRSVGVRIQSGMKHRSARSSESRLAERSSNTDQSEKNNGHRNRSHVPCYR